MHDSELYRQYAQECLDMARRADDDAGRAVLLRMAQVWLRLAEGVSADKEAASEQ